MHGYGLSLSIDIVSSAVGFVFQGSKSPAGDQHKADNGGSAQVNPGGASYVQSRASSPSRITLGGGGSSGGAVPVPVWLKNLSKQLSGSSYPKYIASSSSSNAPATPENRYPSSSRLRFRKMARSSPSPSTPTPSPTTASSVLAPWAAGAGASRYSFQASTPPLMSVSPITGRAPGPDTVNLLAGFQISTAAANKAPNYSSFAEPGSGPRSTSFSSWMFPPLPGRSRSGASAAVCGRGAEMMSPLGFSFRTSGGEQAGTREDEDVMTENPADEEGLELTLGNAWTRKDRA
jgi:hypothetical protein